MKLTFRSLAILTLIVSSLVFAAPAAQANPTINSAMASGNTLTVSGTNMVAQDNKHPLVVLLNNMSLPITSSTATILTATLPAGFVPGSYHLVVGNGNPSDEGHNADLDVTLGTTGLQGPQGLVGATGPQGLVGPAGLTGATGATGPKGDQGPMGAAGAQGQQGIQGVQGSVGPTGPQGTKGDTGAAGAAGATGTQGPAGNQGQTGIGVNGLFGDGSDGDVTITTATTLTRDMYYHNLMVGDGQTLNPGGFRVFVSGTLTLGNGASIVRNGNGDPLNTQNGVGLEPGTLGGSGTGGIGQILTNSLGGSGAGGPGDAGTAIPPAASAGGRGVFRSALQALSGRSLDGALVNGGAGGALGSQDPGGAGGGGGGVVVVAASNVVLSGAAATITANGGNSGTGPLGGSGGGGGVVVVITTTSQPAGLTLSAVGGSGSAPSGAGFTAWLN